MNYNVNIKDKYEIERESREKIEKINNDKDEFISTTSHELRTPVAAIRGYLQLIQFYPEYKDVKPEIIERFSSLENIIEDLSTLIENLLNASRLDLNRIFVNKLNVNINQEVISAIGTVLKKAKKKNITILFNPKVVNIFLILDPEKFIDAISNIIDNSIKFSSENSIILISIENKNNKIKIKIKDKGIGMSKEKLSKLFDKFDNSEENTKKTVLGMYLAKRFIDIIGGNIIVQSKEKIGTTTIIEF